VEFASLILATLSPSSATMRLQRGAALGMTVALLTWSGAAAAADTVASLKPVAEPATELTTRYPLESLTTVETANKAVADAATARAEVEARDLEQRRACYQKFFVNHCLDIAREQRRLAMKAIRPIDIAANAFLRRERADERDRALVIHEAGLPAEAAQKAQDRKEKELSNADKLRQSAAKEKEVAAKTAQHAGEADKRIADHGARLKKAQQDEAAKAQERADNVAAFNRKARESAERQRQVAANKAEKAKELAAKKAATASAPANLAPTPTPTPTPTPPSVSAP
jgi:colicin import membrane protein